MHGYAYSALDGTIRPVFDAVEIYRIYWNLRNLLMTLLCLWKSSQAVFFTSVSSLVTTAMASVLSMQRALLGSCRWSCYLLNITVEYVDAQ